MNLKKNEVVVITGASAGVGRATAREFGKHGASVGLIARNQERLLTAKREIEEAGGRFASFAGKNTIYGGNAYACTPGLEPYIRQLLAPILEA